MSIVLLMALLAGIQAPPTVQGPYVRFVVISDPHIPARGMEAADDVVQAILAMEPPPAFVIDTGDSTELGWRSEIDEYVRRIKEPLEAADIPLYAVPGNHDARWSEYDLQYFRERINPAPQLVRRHGLALMLLNTGLPGEQHGQVEPFELEQLLEQRARTEPYAPLLAFAHHPILEGDPYVSRSIPLVNQLRAAGATALFVGHGHSFRHYRVNGLDQFMTGSVLDRVYRIVEVDWDKVVTWGENTEGEEIAGTRFELPIHPHPTPVLQIRSAHVRPGTREADVVLTRIGGPAEMTAEVWAGAAERVEVTLGDTPTEVSLDVSSLQAGLHPVVARTELEGVGVLRAESEIGIASPTASIDWIRQYQGGIFASPVVDGPRAYVATRSGQLECIDPVSGTRFWGYHLLGGTQSTPALSGNQLVACSALGRVVCLDVRTGTPAWTLTLPSPVRSSPTIHNAKIYVGSGEGALRCIDLRTGEILWEHHVGRLIESRPAVGMGRVVFGAWDQKVHCLNAATGEEVWASDVGSNVYYSPGSASCLIHDGRAYASAANNTIYCYDLITGKTLWQAEGMSGYTSPSVGPDGTIIYGSMDGHLIGLDPATGDDRFRVDVGPGTFNSSTDVAGDMLAVGALHAAVTVASARTGEPVETIDLGETLMFATPAFDGRRVIAGTMDGRLVSIIVNAERSGE